MKLLLLVVFQAIFAFKFEPQGFKLKEFATIETSGQLFPFTLTETDPTHEYNLIIKSICKEDALKTHNINITGTAEFINAALQTQKLPLVTSHEDNYKGSVFIKDLKSGKKKEFDYKFKTVPHIQVENLLQKLTGNITYPFQSFKVADSYKGKKLEVNVEESSPGVELIHKDGYIVLNVKDPQGFPNAKFHIIDEESQKRSADLYIKEGKLVVLKKNRINYILCYVSAGFVIILLVAIIYYYMRPKKEFSRYEGDRITPMPGLVSSNVPRHISLPVDNHAPHNNILDLKDLHNK